MTQEIDLKQLVTMLKEGAVLVDVREAEELKEGALEGTRHWPLSSFGLRESEISKTRPTIFYCRSGLRSLKAAEIASLWTQQDVYSLRGGYLGYLNAVKPEHE